jgi:hypothetical protein
LAQLTAVTTGAAAPPTPSWTATYDDRTKGPPVTSTRAVEALGRAASHVPCSTAPVPGATAGSSPNTHQTDLARPNDAAFQHELLAVAEHHWHQPPAAYPTRRA